MSMRGEFTKVFQDEQFELLYSHSVQPAEALWRLAIATIIQFMEKPWRLSRLLDNLSIAVLINERR